VQAALRVQILLALALLARGDDEGDALDVGAFEHQARHPAGFDVGELLHGPAMLRESRLIRAWGVDPKRPARELRPAAPPLRGDELSSRSPAVDDHRMMCRVNAQ
jgi:hypothetical protein